MPDIDREAKPLQKICPQYGLTNAGDQEQPGKGSAQTDVKAENLLAENRDGGVIGRRKVEQGRAASVRRGSRENADLCACVD